MRENSNTRKRVSESTVIHSAAGNVSRNQYPERDPMIYSQHIERHFTGGEIVRDIVLGMSDGLTVPFALAAGLSGAMASSTLVVTGGLAEVAAGSIAMGLGGYLAAQGDREHYLSERKREIKEVAENPEEERAEVARVFRDYGLKDEQIAPILNSFEDSPQEWVNFMMRFELGMREPDPKQALASALRIAGSYIVAGLIPLAPYMVLQSTAMALPYSILITMIALITFGYVKGLFSGHAPFRSALQTVLIGGLAAGAAFAVAKCIT
jgi:vacuolar iron transporter family protein